MKQTALLALFFAAPTMAFAAVTVDQPLMCDMTATAFFEPLVQRKLINIRPYYVEDSISHFRPTFPFLTNNRGGILAFGMKVDSVFGYASGQMLFARGPGTEPPDTYGVIVQEGIANVQAQLNSMGATRAHTRRISSSRTAITCEGT